MKQLLKSLKNSYPHLTFTAGPVAVWSPETKEVFYNPDGTDEKHIWSLLHETGHALLEHVSYKADVELIRLEMAAWDKAVTLATELGILINEEHIQDCLDTYRDWLYRRSICPTCTAKCLQNSDYTHYRCFNCHTTWKVTPSRFARPYRTTKNVQSNPTLFHALEA